MAVGKIVAISVAVFAVFGVFGVLANAPDNVTDPVTLIFGFFFMVLPKRAIFFFHFEIVMVDEEGRGEKREKKRFSLKLCTS